MAMATSQEQSAADSPKPIFTISSGHKKKITCMAWLPGDRIVTGSMDKTVRIWNVTDRTQEGTSMIHDDEVGQVVATKDGRIVSSCFGDEHLTVWNAGTQELVERPRSNRDYGRPEMLRLSHNERLLASFYGDRFVFWEMVESVRVRFYIRTDEDPEAVWEARFSPNGLRFAVFDARGFSVLDLETGRLFCGDKRGRILCFNSDTGERVGKPWTASGHTDMINFTSLSPDGKWLASGSNDETARFWDAESGNPVGEPLPHEDCVDNIAFSRSGEFVASLLRSNPWPIIWRVPWWDDRNRNAPNALLDISAVVSPDTSGPSNIPDLGFLDVSPPHRPLPPQTHSRENSSSDPPRVQHSVRSWQWWKGIPRLVFLRSHPIYMGRGPPA